MLCQLGSFLAGVVVGGTDLDSLVGSSPPEICFFAVDFPSFFSITFVVLDSLRILLHSSSYMAVTPVVASES